MPSVHENLAAGPFDAQHPDDLAITQDVDGVIAIIGVGIRGCLGPGQSCVQVLLGSLERLLRCDCHRCGYIRGRGTRE